MDSRSARQLIKRTFNYPFSERQYREFIINFLNIDEENLIDRSGNAIKNQFKKNIKEYQKLGSYTDPNGKKLDVMVVKLKNELALERSRTMLRNFTADYLSEHQEKDAALVGYYSENYDDWRFSYIQMEYKLEKSESGNIRVKQLFSPAKRFSYLVGKNEPNHTAQSQLIKFLEQNDKRPTLGDLEDAFSVEKVSTQFYLDYKNLYENLKAELERIIEKDSKIAEEFKSKSIQPQNFAKKLLGQIVFLYFLQKKGWLGVEKDKIRGNFKPWGTGSKNFLSELFKVKHDYIQEGNFFNEILEPLFYNALNNGDRKSDYYERLSCKVPFLNGGLFEPINDYDWVETDIIISNSIIKNVLDIFDTYNFTVRENEPLEKEVAVDPEMLGMVFENLIEENERRGHGTYYTPRTIVHYMCQESLINYLDLSCIEVPKEDIETLMREGHIILEIEQAYGSDSKEEKTVLIESIADYAKDLDDALASVKICDPAIGSGAFPLGMMLEIVKARTVLDFYLKQKKSAYEIKLQCIQQSLYGVDLDPGAIEIAKLRLWLSLVVDEENYETIRALPNLDYKIMQGNSVIEKFHGISLELGKKFTGQIDLFQEVSKIDHLVKDLNINTNEYFRAKHPEEKSIKRDELENTIIEIFRYELRKKHLKDELAKQIEADIRDLTHGKKIRNFFPWQLYFANIFYRDNGGFDIVIANPPYVEQEEIVELKPYLEDNYKTYHGRADLYVYFYELGCKLLRNNGLLTFITSNKFFRAGYGNKLRNFLIDKKNIISIIDFKDAPIFDAASYPAIIQLKNSFRDRTEIIVKAFNWEITGNLDSISHLFKENHINVNQKKLSDNYWVLTNNEIENVLEKMKSNNTSLGDFLNTNICAGIKTGRNEAFFIDQSKREELVKEDSSSEELIKPYFKGKDLRKWITGFSARFIIYTYPGVDISQYPAIEKHLLQYKKSLEKRALNQKWFELQQPQYAYTEIFTKNKIIYPNISKGCKFSFDETKSYLDMTTFCINSSELWLLAILNSSAMTFYFSHLGIERLGGFQEFKTQYVKKLPIPTLTMDQKSNLEKITSSIIKIKKNYEELDENIFKLEEQIQDIVFSAYKLNENDIFTINKILDN